MTIDVDFDELLLTEETKSVANSIYRKCLPDYLQESWSAGRGKWYEDWLREQLDMLVINEIWDDPVRLDELERLQDVVALAFGILGASFRILDHIGMHLRAQTFGQYELLPEDVALLRELCHRFLGMKYLGLNPFSGVLEDAEEDLDEDPEED